MPITRVTCCRLCLLLLSLLVLLLASTPFPAQASSAVVFKFTALSAQADFDSVKGCIETNAFIGAFTNKGETEAAVFVGTFNTCTQTVLLSADGQTSHPNFQISKSLKRASLHMTLPVTDENTGHTFTVSVNMTWKSTGPRVHDERGNFHDKFDCFQENLHFSADYRNAVASGTVSDGSTNFTPGPSADAQIMFEKSLDVSISHC